MRVGGRGLRQDATPIMDEGPSLNHLTSQDLNTTRDPSSGPPPTSLPPSLYSFDGMLLSSTQRVCLRPSGGAQPKARSCPRAPVLRPAAIFSQHSCTTPTPHHFKYHLTMLHVCVRLREKVNW